jgi:predicted peptidase
MNAFESTRRFICFIAVSLLVCACGSKHSFSETEFPARTVTIDNTNYGYRVYLPLNRDPNKKVPIMLFLHGSGARGDDNFEQIDGLRWAIEPLKEKVDFIIVIPQCRRDTFWASTEMAKYALAALDQTVKEFNGDENRLYLSGFSLGGYGAWQIAAAHPGKFAALVPVAGGVVGERPIEPRDRAAIIPEVGTMLDSPEPYQAVAKALGQTPVWAFHGSSDEAVPVEFSRKIAKALADAENKNVKYTEYPNEGHMIFGRAFSEPGLLEWLSNQKLNDAK